MNAIKTVLMLALLCAGAVHAAAPDVPKSAREAASAWSESGLQKVSGERPG
jgi:hypothetical protein